MLRQKLKQSSYLANISALGSWPILWKSAIFDKIFTC